MESMADEDVLEFPVYGVNDTTMKHCFDNVHGTGESSLTNVVITTPWSTPGRPARRTWTVTTSRA